MNNHLNKINNSINKARHARDLLFLDKEKERFIRHNKKVWRGWINKESDSVILVDFYNVCETIISYSYFLNILARKHRAVIKSFAPPVRRIPNRVLHRVYQSFNVSGHISIVLNRKQKIRMKAISKGIISNLKTKEDVFNLNVLGIWAGIDIYETYLRNYRKPTVFMDDPNLYKVIEEGISLVIFWKDFFVKNGVAAVVVSHICYLSANIVSKVAYQNKVPVYLPNIRGAHLVDRPFSVQTYFRDYRKMFNRLSPEEQRRGIALAKKQLERRLSGEAAVDMHYSSKSAFHSFGDRSRILRENKKIKVLICSHCFYDNPHAYEQILFIDFYEWLHYLGKISERTDYDWYLKMHPDALPGTLETIQEILLDFPKIIIIPQETSHQQLAKEGINFVLTVYGSVGHECSALGIQVINAGYNPHIAYDFNWHPQSLEEYEYYLLNLDKLHKEIKMEDLYEFYYMHYYYTVADDFILKSYRQYLSELTIEQRIGPTAYIYFLNQLTDAKHQEIISNMQKFIDSGKQHYFSYGPE